MITELIIERGPRPWVAQGLHELRASREVVWASAQCSTRLKDKQAVLGVMWAILQLLSFLAIFVAVFERVPHH